MKKFPFHKEKKRDSTASETPINIIEVLPKQYKASTRWSNKVAPLSATSLPKAGVGDGLGSNNLEEKDAERSITISTRSISESTASLKTIEREDGLSWAATLVNFIKGMIGPGCLSLPLAFKQAGLWTAFALVLLFGFLNNHCMLQMVHCSQYLSRKKEKEHLDYGGVAQEACANSFQCLRKYKLHAKMVVNTAILGLQMGICSVLYVFMAVHMKEVFDEQTNFHASETMWMFLILLPVILLNFIRTLKAIALISMIGNVLCICAFMFILQHLLRAEHVTSHLPWFTSFDGVMTACGSIMYAFEGQAMVLPLENKLKKPKDMTGPFGVLSVGVALVSVVYAGSGLFGYITYGSDVKGSITLNLPQQLSFTFVKLMLTLVVYFGFVIQQYVIVEMLWPSLRKSLGRVRALSRPTLDLPLELTFRAGLVILATFIFPALMDTLTFVPPMLQPNKGIPKSRMAYLRLLKNGVLLLIGVFGLVAGLQSNIRNMIRNGNQE